MSVLLPHSTSSSIISFFGKKNVLPKTVLAVSVHKIFLHWNTSNHQRAKMYLFLNKQTKNTVFVSFLLFFCCVSVLLFFVFTTHLHTHKTPFFILHQMFLFRLRLVGLIEQQQKKPTLKTARWTTTTINAKTVYIVNKRFFMVSLPRCDGMVVVFFCVLFCCWINCDYGRSRARVKDILCLSMCAEWSFSFIRAPRFNVLVFCQ